MTRLFVAAWPPPDVAEQLALVADVDEESIRPVPIERLHVTLRFIGDADAGKVVSLLERADLTAADAVLGPAVVRLGGRRLVVPVAGAETLAAAVRGATHGLGEADRHAFFGHVTLARSGRDATSSLEGAPAAGGFRLDDIRLVESRLESTGSVYTTIHTFDVR